MLQTEYVRSLNCNYQRILLDKRPEENRYQYCMINRGGIKGLLSCSLRYIDGYAYLYYDISSTQNVAQIFTGKAINRFWMKDFLWSMQQANMELSRFLLDDRNIQWHPEQIFQDVEKNDFYFLYIPYYDGDNGFLNLVDFWVEHIDYDDEVLVECIYKMHEQFEFLGSVYLQEQIFEDAKVLDKIPQVIAFDSYHEEALSNGERSKQMPGTIPHAAPVITPEVSCIIPEPDTEGDRKWRDREQAALQEAGHLNICEENKISKRGIWYLLEGKRRREKVNKESHRREIIQRMEGLAVSEETPYPDEKQNEDFGKTIYIEEMEEKRVTSHGLYTREGKKAAEIMSTPFIIGKKKEEAHLVLEDHSVSRIHARIIKENDKMYLEDMNSTNGTFKNGLRMQPYEKKLLEEEDEVKFGKKEFTFR